MESGKAASVVIASEAKQSIRPHRMDCFARNDGGDDGCCGTVPVIANPPARKQQREPQMSDASSHAAGWRPATYYPDPAIRALDPRFEKYWLKLSAVERLATGCAGPRARSGSATDAICCAATSPTSASSSGRKKAARLASTENPPTSPTATPATARAGSSPANM